MEAVAEALEPELVEMEEMVMMLINLNLQMDLMEKMQEP